MDPSTLNQQLWLQYLAALQQQITVQGAPQFVNPYLVWDWGGQNGVASGLPMAQYMTLDQVPQNPSSDSTTYGAKPGFGEAYNLFLQMLDQTPGSSDPQYAALQQDVKNAANNETVTIGNAITAYQNFKASTQTTESYSAWLGNEGAGYQAQISLAQGAVATAQTHLSNFLASRTNAIAAAIKQYGANLTAVSNPNNPLVSNTYPGWTLTELPYNYVLQITNNNFGGNAVAGSAKSFTLTQDTEQYNYQKDWAEGGFGGFFDFFGIEGEGSYSKVSVSEFSDQYRLTFGFQDLTTVGVSAGAWYTPGLAGVYQNGPFFEGYSGFQSGANTYFFGPGGQLARQISALIVGYRPSITLTATDAFVSQVQTQYEAEGGLIIGPFAFEAAGGSSSEADSVQFSGATIKAQSNGNWPYIVAIVSGWTVDPPQAPALREPALVAAKKR